MVMYNPTSPVNINIAKISNNTELLVLGIAAKKEFIIVLHHFIELGDLPDMCVIAMFGNGNAATPLVIDCAESDNQFYIDLPRWEDL
jgi:hypothetical protein